MNPSAPPAERKKHARAIWRLLAREYPDVKCALNYRTPMQLLVATILSAQCTDARVNMVTPALFAKYPDAKSFAKAKPEELEAAIRSTGFYKNKARSIMGAAAAILNRHDGQVPVTMEDLVKLPGVGRKTANVVLGNAFNTPGITVDTHMQRVSKRIGLTDETDPVKIEFDLNELIPRADWTHFSHAIIHHGQRICDARKPRCVDCVVRKYCRAFATGDLPRGAVTERLSAR
ncbi:endonuclease III [bacterium]|nr:endonuclease III [bacterium]